MQIDSKELKEFVENNPKLVIKKESKRWPGLFVLKYTRRVFFDNLWNQHSLLLECRGLVVDSDYNVIVKPFTKVFNHNENGTTINRDESCVVVRKVNGFMGVATYDPNISKHDMIYSTTGSLDSDFVDLVAKHIEPYKKTIIHKLGGSKMTLIFEICDESDPHIIEEKLGAWLIGAYWYMDDRQIPVKESVLDSMAQTLGCYRPENFLVDRFSDVVDMANDCDHEGYMVQGLKSGTTLKIKSPYYLVTKFLARASETKLMNTIFSGEVRRAREKVDEEFFPLIDFLIEYSEEFKEADEQRRISIIREFLRNK